MFGDRRSVIISVLVFVAAATALWGASARKSYGPATRDNARRTREQRLAARRIRPTARLAGPGKATRRLDGEFQIDTTFDVVPDPQSQDIPSCATDGEQYLVVWENENGSRHISGSRVTGQGVVLDPLGITITDSLQGNWSAMPAVAFAGSSYLVVWTDSLAGTGAVWGCRVGRDGVVLDSAPIRISSTPSPQPRAAVASDGVNSLVVWQNAGPANTATIYGARVGPTGVVLDSVSFPIPESAAAQSEPAVAFDGSGWFVVWSEFRPGSDSDILGRHVGPNGAPVDSHDVVVSNAARDQEAPCIAFDGTDCLVAWRDLRNSNLGDIYGARVTGSGEVREPDGIAICGHDGWQAQPALTFTGAFWLAAWADDRFGNDIYGTRVNPDGSVADTEGYPIRLGEAWNPNPTACSDSSGRSLVAWTGGDIWAQRVDSSGSDIDTSSLLLSGVFPTQDNPAVASDGANYLAVWENSGASGTMVCAERVSPTGQPLDTAHLNLSAPNSGSLPKAAFGTNYLAVWWDESGSFALRASRVTPSGVVLDPGGIGIGPQKWVCYCADVASDGDNFLAVWDAQAPTGELRVYGSRISAGGTVLDTTFAVGGDTNRDASYPAAAFNGSDYLVAWADYDYNQSVSSVRAARVTPEGVVRDSAAIVLASVLTDDPYPAVASDGTNWLVAWSSRDSNGARVVTGTRVSPEGTVLDSNGIGIAPPNDSSLDVTPCAAFDGANYVVTWQRYSNGQSYSWATLVSPQGAVVGSVLVTTMNVDGEPLPIAHGSGQQTLAVFAAYTDSVNRYPVNGNRVWGKLSPFTGLAENPVSELRSGKMATIVRGVLYLPSENQRLSQGFRSTKSGTVPVFALLDATGRRVAELRPGPNDVSRFEAGVYFVRSEPSAVNRQPSAVYKVVITR